MKFNLQKGISILERTPKVLENYLSGLSKDWTHANEGDGTWSPVEIVAHLILGEKTDWMIRAEIILSDRASKDFVPFDMESHLQYAKAHTIQALLNEFTLLRGENIEKLKAMNLTSDQLKLTGMHSEFGEVPLRELLSTWVAHDLGHISQISRVMAKQYQHEVGPWTKYLGILTNWKEQ